VLVGRDFRLGLAGAHPGHSFWNGFAGLNLDVFTQDTPGPNTEGGGLRNALVGSLIMTALGVGIGTPIGILAGTYMAEYGRYSRLTFYIRFVNDILLSAPSIASVSSSMRR